MSRRSNTPSRWSPSRSRPSRAAWLLLAALLPAPRPLAAAAALVVEGVPTASAWSQAGLRVGDHLVSWRREPSAAAPEGAAGTFDSPFEARRVEFEEAPRGPLRAQIRRGDDDLTLEIPAGDWDLELRPPLDPPDLDLYRQGWRAITAGAPRDGTERWLALADRWADRGDHLLAAWLLAKTARTLVARAPAADWRQVYQRARSQATLAEDRGAGLELGRAQAGELAKAGRLREGVEISTEILAERDDAGDHLGLAPDLIAAGGLERRLGQLDRAASHLGRALRILDREAPASYLMANCLRSLAVVDFQSGDFATGERRQLRALELLQRLAPTSLLRAQLLTNQASLAFRRGDLEGAERLYQEAYVLLERLRPADRETAAILTNLVGLHRRRGDSLAAERVGRRAVEILEGTAPGSPELAIALASLGEIAAMRGDLRGAGRWIERAFEVQDRVAPHDPFAATLLAILSRIAHERGDPTAVEHFIHRARERLRRNPSRNLDAATARKQLATVELARGNTAAARHAIEAALEIEEAIIPESQAVADSLRVLGEVTIAEGDPGAAEPRLERALEIDARAAPGTLGEARSAHLLGKVHQLAGHTAEALELLSRAAAIADRPHGRLGGDYESRATVRSQLHRIYGDYLRLLLATGNSNEAFSVLERSRSRAFLDLLATRDLSLAGDLPPELERERRRAQAAYDEALRALFADGGAVPERLSRRLEEARAKREDVRAKIRLAAPRSSALGRPGSLDLEEAWEVLDPGTLFLSYAVAAEEAHLFALGPDPRELAVYPLGIGAGELAREVLRFRDALHPGRPAASLERLARRLTARLLGPAAEQIERAERLVIATESPLHDLAFATLAAPGPETPFRFLVEARPLSRIHSLASFVELERRRPKPVHAAAETAQGAKFIAFGDPVYPRPDTPKQTLEPVLRGALENGFELHPLPATRDEVEAIGRLFPHAETYLGPEATEERAKALAGRASVLHFASHVLVDEELPLESAIALTIPERRGDAENGLLQAWEIFEQVRLGADLVTLSGCETAGGRTLAGEGMIGLSQAFQYAGATTVLASLWKVPDTSTSRLMGRFYHHLKEGASKNAALRRAQLDLLRGDSPTDRSPYFWAAFQLIGDWR